jgi:NitT/TauT family transport system substrate-binding protein
MNPSAFTLIRTLAFTATATGIALISGWILPHPMILAESKPSDPEMILAQNESLTPVKFTLSWLLQGVDAPMTLAMERGYFAEAGLDVSFERGFGSADSLGKIAAGQFDMGFGDAYSMIEFNQKNPDQPLIAVAIPYNRSPFSIITLKENGITTPEELASRTLGAPAGDAPRRLWPVFAQQVGVAADSVEWVTMEPKLRESFLLNGEVDAISGFVYSALPALVNGGAGVDKLNIFYYNDYGINFYGNAIITRADFAAENPEVIRAFLAAFIRGFQETLRDPAAGLATVLEADAGGLMKEADEKLRLQIALENLWVTPEVEENGLATIDPERFAATIAQVVEGFGLSSTPTVDQVFDGSFLPPKEERLVPPASELGSL